jgi:hypothetical protein
MKKRLVIYFPAAPPRHVAYANLVDAFTGAVISELWI